MTDSFPLNDLHPDDPPYPAPPTTSLIWIARDAAQRATALLAGTPPITDPLVDAVRLLHECRDNKLAEAVAEHAGLRPAELARLRAAFTFGGPPGVHVALHHLEVDHDLMERAAAAIQSDRSGKVVPLRVEGNWIIDDAVNVQVRLGPEGRWYPFTATVDGNWAPARSSSNDPAGAYQAAIRAVRSRRS